MEGAIDQVELISPMPWYHVLLSACRGSRRKGQDQHRENDGGNVKTHQRVEWAGQHQSASANLGVARRLYEVPGAWPAAPWPWACWAASWDCHQSAM